MTGFNQKHREVGRCEHQENQLAELPPPEAIAQSNPADHIRSGTVQ